MASRKSYGDTLAFMMLEALEVPLSLNNFTNLHISGIGDRNTKPNDGKYAMKQLIYLIMYSNM
jgi:hypothetical protein